MKQASAIISVSIAVFSTTASAFQTSSITPPTRPISQEALILSAAPSSQAGWGSSRGGIPSKTARESAWAVEWEPMTELERRIEDGVNYEHIPNHYSSQYHANNGYSRTSSEDGTPYSHGIFCGYRYTDEEYGRLKSADPTVEY